MKATPAWGGKPGVRGNPGGHLEAGEGMDVLPGSGLCGLQLRSPGDAAGPDREAAGGACEAAEGRSREGALLSSSVWKHRFFLGWG